MLRASKVFVKDFKVPKCYMGCNMYEAIKGL